MATGDRSVLLRRNLGKGGSAKLYVITQPFARTIYSVRV